MVDSRGAGSGGGVLPARGSRRIAGGSRSGDGTVFLRVLLACAVVVSVVFEEPEGWRNPGRTAVKRVAAMAGDTVSLHGGGLWVNGRMVAALPESCVSGNEATVPDGGVFVVGDNRAVSRDSMTVACESGSVLDGVVSLSFVRGVVR